MTQKTGKKVAVYANNDESFQLFVMRVAAKSGKKPRLVFEDIFGVGQDAYFWVTGPDDVPFKIDWYEVLPGVIENSPEYIDTVRELKLSLERKNV